MFNLADTKEIGQYLSKKIKEKYKSVRQFCIEYIKLKNKTYDDDEIQNMANRLSQIINGKKHVQIYDLPFFTKLLNISCEELLSAGKSFVQQGNRASNYAIAFSKNEKEWLDYINRNDKLILNPDEYGKTAIDYAIEFKNYKFIRFLIRKKYIWFDSRKDNDYIMTFGAGTSIQRREPYRIDDYLKYKLSTEDQLRIDVITLAINNNDTEILDELHARELPELYSQTHYLYASPPDFARRYDDDFVKSISKASDKIIDYFTDEFEIRNQVKYRNGDSKPHTFMFPFTSALLDYLIESNNSFTEIALKKAIEHNKKTYEILKQLIEAGIENLLNQFNFYGSEYMELRKPDLIKEITREFSYYENGNIVSFRTYYNSAGIITNIIHTESTSKNPKLQYLINELNNLFEKITNIENEFI